MVIGLGLHAVLVLVGYAAMDAISIIDEFVYLWAQSDFILAVAAMALLVAVVVSSIAAARRRLPAGVPVPAARLGLAAAPGAGDRSDVGGAQRLPHRGQRTQARPTGSAGGPVPALALPRPRPVVAPAPLLRLRGALGGPAADHGPGAGRGYGGAA